MADRALVAAAAARPIWMKQAEEAKLKSEAEKAAAAKAAFEATFKDVEKAGEKEAASSDSDVEESEDLSSKPIGPLDPSKCTAAGVGVAGGTACAPTTFVVTTKDSDGRRISTGGAELKVRISPGVGVGGSDQDGMVKDMGDGTYTVTYAVPKRGNYMVHVECDGKPIMGSPFPVFFSANTPGGVLGVPPSTTFPNLVNQTMPNMPNYAGSVSGAFPGLLGMIPGVVNGASGGVMLPGMGASLGEVCREYLNGRCVKTDCKFSHPPHNLLMTALATTSTVGSVNQVPMAPSAAAMAAAQAIVAAQALQAHAAQVQAQAKASGDASGSSENVAKADALKKTLQVSNLNPLLTVEQLKQLFGYCGTVVECSITDSKHFAYIEYSKPEEANAALALNNIDVGGRHLNVEMAKSLPSKLGVGNSSLHQSSLMMQQAVAMQQMQFQQALLMQQTLASQQAASRAATMKSATELASARAAEISRKLKAEGLGKEEKEANHRSRSPSPSRQRSKSRSRSPIKHRRKRQSPSLSPSKRRHRDRRSRSPLRSRHYMAHSSERRSYRDAMESYRRSGRWEQERYFDHYSNSQRKRSRSVSPRPRRSSRVDSVSPKRHKGSMSPKARKSSRPSSRSPRRSRDHRSPSRRNRDTSRRSRHSRSRSSDGRHHYNATKDTRKPEKSKLDYAKSDKSHEKSRSDRRKLEKSELRKESDAVTKYSRDKEEDKFLDSYQQNDKKAYVPNEDRNMKKAKDSSRHETSRVGDKSSRESEAADKTRDLVDKSLLLDEGRNYANTPVLKSHKSGSRSMNNGNQPVDEDPGRPESLIFESNADHEENDSEKSENECMEHDSTLERRGKKDSSKSRSHRRSIKHLDSSSSRDLDVKSRQEESKVEYRKHEELDESRDDYFLSDTREGRSGSSKMKSRRMRSPSLEDASSRDQKDKRQKSNQVDMFDKICAITDQRYSDFDSTVMEGDALNEKIEPPLKERIPVHYEVPVLEENETSLQVGSRIKSEVEFREFDKSDATNETNQNYIYQGSIEISCNGSSNLPEAVYVGNSATEELSKDAQDYEERDYVFQDDEKTRKLCHIKEHDCSERQANFRIMDNAAEDSDGNEKSNAEEPLEKTFHTEEDACNDQSKGMSYKVNLEGENRPEKSDAEGYNDESKDMSYKVNLEGESRPKKSDAEGYNDESKDMSFKVNLEGENKPEKSDAECYNDESKDMSYKVNLKGENRAEKSDPEGYDDESKDMSFKVNLEGENRPEKSDAECYNDESKDMSYKANLDGENRTEKSDAEDLKSETICHSDEHHPEDDSNEMKHGVLPILKAHRSSMSPSGDEADIGIYKDAEDEYKRETSDAEGGKPERTCHVQEQG